MLSITVPLEGYCQCGCGQKTRVAKKTRSIIGHVKGQPIPYLNGHNRRKQERYRVEDRGYTTPCWTWQLGKNKWGYGHAHNPGGSSQAHRAVYEEHHGPIGPPQLDHLCRNRDCVNPDHMEPVTHPENIQRGDLAKLVPEEVRAIRHMLSKQMARKEIAEVFNVHVSTIGYIARGKTWANIE